MQEQVLATVRYFDVQDHPVTLLEVWKYLLAGQASATIGEVLAVLSGELAGTVETLNGFYFLTGRSSLVAQRLRNNFYATPRLKRASRYLRHVRHVPFIEAVALTGSEALANSKHGSDIDLFIITQPRRMWLGRLAITVYFQLTGLRRHGVHVADRFCLNHYVAGSHCLGSDHNVYTAVEYTSLIPYFGGGATYEFQRQNLGWISEYLQQPYVVEYKTQGSSKIARGVESIFANRFGDWLDAAVGRLQAAALKYRITSQCCQMSYRSIQAAKASKYSQG